MQNTTTVTCVDETDDYVMELDDPELFETRLMCEDGMVRLEKTQMVDGKVCEVIKMIGNIMLQHVSEETLKLLSAVRKETGDSITYVFSATGNDLYNIFSFVRKVAPDGFSSISLMTTGFYFCNTRLGGMEVMEELFIMMPDGYMTSTPAEDVQLFLFAGFLLLKDEHRTKLVIKNIPNRPFAWKKSKTADEPAGGFDFATQCAFDTRLAYCLQQCMRLEESPRLACFLQQSMRLEKSPHFCLPDAINYDLEPWIDVSKEAWTESDLCDLRKYYEHVSKISTCVAGTALRLRNEPRTKYSTYACDVEMRVFCTNLGDLLADPVTGMINSWPVSVPLLEWNHVPFRYGMDHCFIDVTRHVLQD
jgi:hypothetical protein